MAYGPVSLPSAVSHRWFLVVVFAAIGVVIATSFVLYSAQPPRPPPTDNLVFSSAAFVGGNASVIVQNVSRGPYLFSGFQILLIVNEFAGGPVALEPNNSIARMTIGPNHYRIAWSDSNGDGAVDVGDSFRVSGDGGPLPVLSYYEFDLHWEMQWTAKATWSTS